MPKYKIIMIQRGIMQKAVAEKVRKTDPRVDTSLMSKIVNGICLPTPRTLETICKTLACKPLDIYDRAEITLAPPTSAQDATGGGKRSTMDVEIKPDGLHVRTTLDIENNATARELCSAVTRGDIEDMSFAFGVLVSGYEWRDLDTDMPTRRITKISKVFEVSAVNDGAYPQTSIYARSPASLDNDKIALANAKAAALENEQRRQADESQAAAKLELAKQKFLFVEEQRNYENP